MFYSKFIEKKTMLILPTAAVKSPVKGYCQKVFFSCCCFIVLLVGTSIHDELEPHFQPREKSAEFLLASGALCHKLAWGAGEVLK